MIDNLFDDWLKLQQMENRLWAGCWRNFVARFESSQISVFLQICGNCTRVWVNAQCGDSFCEMYCAVHQWRAPFSRNRQKSKKFENFEHSLRQQIDSHISMRRGGPQWGGGQPVDVGQFSYNLFYASFSRILRNLVVAHREAVVDVVVQVPMDAVAVKWIRVIGTLSKRSFRTSINVMVCLFRFLCK